MSSSKPSIPKGTRDFGPKESARRNYIVDKIKAVFKKYGFNQIETPAMEQLSTLTGKYGDEGDQLLFKILNSGNFLKDVDTNDLNKGSKHTLNKLSEKGLRYDLTVPFARFVVQNQNNISFPFKRFQIQPVWRADRPQKGRYREFYQCDADIVGTNSLWNEAELTLLIHEVFKGLNYPNFTLKINHRQILNALAEYVGLGDRVVDFCVAIDKLDKIGEEKVREELNDMGAIAEKVSSVFEYFMSEKDHLKKLEEIGNLVPDNQGVNELRQYFNYLSATSTQNLKVELDFSLARGLTYYTGMIFEVKANDVKIGSICGGGRYDNLTGVFGLNNVSGVGISFGLDRIYDVLTEKDLFPAELGTAVDVVILHLDEQCFAHGLGVLSQLRAAAISSEIFPDQAKTKKQFNYANKSGAAWALIIGSDEMEKGTYTLKNLQTGEQVSLSIDEIIEQVMKSD